jgi:hypothetical protein
VPRILITSRSTSSLASGAGSDAVSGMRLNDTDVAQLLRISEASVHRLVQRGRLRGIRKGRGKRRVYVTDSVVAEMDRRGLAI